MLDKSALEKIQELVSAQQPIETDTPTAIIAGNNNIASLEKYMQHPNRFVSEFSTHAINEFIAYSTKNNNIDTITYVDTDRATAVSIFDHGTPEQPEWGGHKAHLKLKQTPAYESLLLNDKKHFDQQELIDFLTDWEEHVALYEENDSIIPIKEALNRIRRVKINKSSSAELEQGDFKSEHSAMESIEISSGQDKLPAYFVFTTPPHDGFSEYSFTCGLRASTNGSELSIFFRIKSLESRKLEIGNELKAIITRNITDDTKIYLGTVNHR